LINLDIGTYGINYTICNDRIFFTLAKNCSKLRFLNLRSRVNNQCIMLIIQNCTQLEYLNIMGTNSFIVDITPGYKTFGNYCRNLVFLNILDTRFEFREVAMMSIFENCHFLRKLYSSRFTPQLILSLTSNCLLITHLYMGISNEIEDESIIKLADQYKNLKLFSITHNTSLSNVGLSALADRCHELTYLNITYCENIRDSDILKVAKGCPELRFLSTRNTRVKYKATAATIISQCKKLKYFESDNCSEITTKFILNSSNAKYELFNGADLI